MGEGTELPPVDREEGVSDVQTESKRLDDATTDPEAFVEHEMDLAVAEATQTALLEVLTIEEDASLVPPPVDESYGTDDEGFKTEKPSIEKGTQKSGPSTEDSSIIVGDQGVSSSGATDQSDTQNEDIISIVGFLDNLNESLDPESATAFIEDRSDRDSVSFEEFLENEVGLGDESADESHSRVEEYVASKKSLDDRSKEIPQTKEEISIVSGVETPDSGLHDSIEADISASGASSEDSLRDIVNDSKTELGGASKATGHGVYSKSRELPVSTAGEGGEPEPVMGDLSTLGGLRVSDSEGSVSESSESQEQAVMEDLSIVAGVETQGTDAPDTGDPVVSTDGAESTDSSDEGGAGSSAEGDPVDDDGLEGGGVYDEEGGGDDGGSDPPSTSQEDGDSNVEDVESGSFSKSFNMADVERTFADICNDIRSGGVPMDINALVQSVLREAYLETSGDLEYHTDKNIHFNAMKEALRDQIDEIRDQPKVGVSDTSAVEAISITDATPAEALEDISIVAGVEIPTGEVESSEGITSADETSGTGVSDSDLDHWENNEPSPPDPDNFDLSTKDGKAQYDAAMEDYIYSYMEWAASKPPDEGDDDAGSDRGDENTLPVTDPSLDESTKNLAQSLKD